MPDAVQYDVLEAVQSTISGMSLSGITTNVRLLKIPLDTDLGSGKLYSFPVCLVSPALDAGEAIQYATNLQDDVIYPVQVTFVDKENQSQSANFNRDLQWRETTRKAFHHKRLSGVGSVYLCEVSPGPIWSSRAYLNQLYVSSLIVRCYSRESRS